jgi:hypothetical protein
MATVKYLEKGFLEILLFFAFFSARMPLLRNRNMMQGLVLGKFVRVEV